MAKGKVAGAAGDGSNSSINSPVVNGGGSDLSRNHLLHDRAVTFEEYRYFAEITRAEETRTANTEPPSRGIMQTLFPTKSSKGVKQISTSPGSPRSSNDEKDEKELINPDRQYGLAVTDDEWTNASRAMRTASGAACFYLITTDILGPFGIGLVNRSTDLRQMLTPAAFPWEPWDGAPG